MKKVLSVFTAAALATFAAPAVHAQSADDFPSKPIRLIVSFPPGGSTDMVARLIAPIMTERLGQQVIVENRGGAGGNIAMGALARTTPDGYTIGLSGAGALGINGVLYRNLNYDPVKDLTPITLVSTSPFVLVGPADSQYKDIGELLADARKNPGKISLGHGGNGTVMHLASELFNDLGKVKTVTVPYKGTGPATIDAMGGQIQLAMSDTTTAVNYIKDNRLKAYAVTTPKRSDSLPGVPTLQEAGLEGYDAMGWFGIAAPAGTPEPIVKRLNEAITAALKDPSVVERINAVGATSSPSTPEEFRQLIANDIEKWGTIINRLNLHID